MNRKWLGFAGILVGMSAAMLEKSLVATALPTITAEFGSIALYSWVFGAYMLASTTTIPLFGKLADLKGRRVLYLGGMALFLIGSALAATAVSMPQLVLYRVIQGTGAGAIAPAALAAIGDLFPSATRGRAFGVIGAVSILANLAGPLLGGWVTDALSWRWGFALILPVGGVAALLVAIGLPAHKSVREQNGRIDWQGAATMGMALSGVLVGLDAIGTGGASLGPGTAVALIAVFLFFAGIRLEQRHPNPVLPLPLLRLPSMKSALTSALFLGVVTHSAIAYIPLFVRETQGATATGAGLALLPMMVATGVASGVGGWLAGRWGSRLNLAAWLLTGAGFLLLFSNAGAVAVYVASGLIGAGMGLLLPVLLHVAQDEAGETDRAAISGMLQLARNLGGATGVPLLGIWLSSSAETGTNVLAIFASLAVVAAAGLVVSLKQ